MITNVLLGCILAVQCIQLLISVGRSMDMDTIMYRLKCIDYNTDLIKLYAKIWPKVNKE